MLTIIKYVAISPYNNLHYFIAFRDQSIKYDFSGAPAEWMKLMTEVFDIWQAERLQKPQQQYFPPNPFPHPLYQPVQPQQQAAYYYNNYVAEISPPPVHVLPMSPPLTPSTPLTGYQSPALSNAAPTNPYAYRPPLQGVVEMPVELPGNIELIAQTPAPARSISTEVSGCLPVYYHCMTNDLQKKKKRILSRLF